MRAVGVHGERWWRNSGQHWQASSSRAASTLQVSFPSRYNPPCLLSHNSQRHSVLPLPNPESSNELAPALEWALWLTFYPLILPHWIHLSTLFFPQFIYVQTQPMLLPHFLLESEHISFQNGYTILQSMTCTCFLQIQESHTSEARIATRAALHDWLAAVQHRAQRAIAANKQ